MCMCAHLRVFMSASPILCSLQVDTVPCLPPDSPCWDLAHSRRVHVAGTRGGRSESPAGRRLRPPRPAARCCQSFEMRTLSAHALSCPREGCECLFFDVPFPPTTPPGSVGSRWRDYSALAIIMAGIAFGFHQLYKVSLPPPAHPHPLAFTPFSPLVGFIDGEDVRRGCV